jgi:hypothetical protein
MATTTTILGVSLIKGPHAGGDQYLFEISAHFTGTYLTGTEPTLDVLAALQGNHEGITAVAVRSVACLQDGINNAASGTSAGLECTVADADVALSSTGNKLATFDINYSPTATGTGGTELGNTDPIDLILTFAVLTGVTPALH